MVNHTETQLAFGERELVVQVVHQGIQSQRLLAKLGILVAGVMVSKAKKFSMARSNLASSARIEGLMSLLCKSL